MDPHKTTTLKAGETPPPSVFVDASGRRHRGLRRVALVAGVVVLLALGALWVTQLTHPVRPERVTPCAGTASAGPTCVHR